MSKIYKLPVYALVMVIGAVATFFATTNSTWFVHRPEAPKSLLK
ncbi:MULTISPECIES: cyclic lactone autoinducer peptide [Paenibacillus]|nr:cyclic lactone autoinducer peptide [Paenibacillus oleatilyticus]MBU7316061.1 cyclic lactone autoinducer peptide [Paenibacillus oleatilyticus]GMX64493.1 hypothetical protein Elgi_37620 [Paenibacillus elgii]